jgi:NTE family protein
MSRKRIAIACQGGGSQCAFVAGALKTLLTHGVHEQFDIVGLSGTSGGALTAALAWKGLVKNALGDSTPVEKAMIDLWSDLAASTPSELLFDGAGTKLLRLVEGGMLPSVALSPTSLPFRLLPKLSPLFGMRPEFTDLRLLLNKHLDCDAMRSLAADDGPTLLIAAADVLEGSFRIFSSDRGEVTVDALLASAAIPDLFPAVWVDGHAYWDGIFSSNPPVTAFLRRHYMGSRPLPQEIWIIQVNPTHIAEIPEKPCDISDRRNHMAGNLSLRHELEMIELVNLLIRENAFTAHFRALMKFDTTEMIGVRFIRMSEEILEHLDYPTKLSRQPALLKQLMDDGENQARAFLDEITAPNHPPVFTNQTAAAGMNGAPV